MKSTVLCYNLKGTKKGKKIAMIFGYLGYKVRHVEKEEYLCSIGTLLETRRSGVEDGEKEEAVQEKYTGEGFKEEMLVIHAASEDMLDKALFLMKKDKVQVPLKAVVTPSNQEWNSMALYEEILKEHIYMTEKKAAEDN